MARLILVLFCFVAVAAVTIEACTCPTWTFDQKLDHASFVLKGLVRKSYEEHHDDGAYLYYLFDLHTAFNSTEDLKCGKHMWLKTYLHEEDCGSILQENQEYVLTGGYYKNPTGHDDVVYINSCGLQALAADVQADPSKVASLARFTPMCGEAMQPLVPVAVNTPPRSTRSWWNS
eukprot:GILJ01010672.1.p1 GENE.GILJ01010672.1~~GILJ01010672.1.p1  ORF type:complete len:175 (+),score=12.95 GILJ01010672.1:156-680(+)